MAKTGALGHKENSEYVPQVSGLATIKTGEQFAMITFEDNSKTFDNGTAKKKIALSDLPKYPKLPTNTEKHYRVRLNKEGDAVDSIFPAEGHFNAKVIDMGRRANEGDDPQPYEKVFGAGTPKESRHLEFYVTYKIVKGAMKGATAPYFLHYKFDDNGDGQATFTGNPDNPKATRLQQLIEWCNKHGTIEEPITWPEDGNILPELLERAMDADREVEVIVKNGYIQDVLDLGGYDDDAEPEDEEEKPKAKAKAAPAKAGAAKKVARHGDDEDEDDL